MAVIKVVCKNLKNHPQCPHGPTLKFVRVRNGLEEEFFACSAYRDRRDCAFFHRVGDKLSSRLWSPETQRVLPTIDHAAAQQRLLEVKRAEPKDRLYCHTCSEIDLMSNRQRCHNGHDMKTEICDEMLLQPSKIFKLKEGAKKEAQYLFDDTSVQVIVDNLRAGVVTSVLCLGTPRIHEYIQTHTASGMQSLLLDLDHRYHTFWSEERFVWYNMFNRHTLGGGKGKSIVKGAMTTEGRGRVALVMDPPFGGHVEPLAATVKYFSRLLTKCGHAHELIVVWVFPYFRERHIIDKCPSLSMVDYKVQYNNHKEFNNGVGGRKLGSPVRLFTNLPLSRFRLPSAQGYRYCPFCTRWVSAENKHCTKCATCPSKCFVNRTGGPTDTVIIVTGVLSRSGATVSSADPACPWSIPVPSRQNILLKPGKETMWSQNLRD